MKTTTPATAWKYVVRPLANFHDGRFWDEWRIERSRQVEGGKLIETEPVCDVLGPRKKALELARQLNGVQKMTVQLAEAYSAASHWMANYLKVCTMPRRRKATA